MKIYSRNLRDILFNMFPAVITMSLFVIGFLPTYIAGLASFFPSLYVISIFYWSIYIPKSSRYWLVFAMGLIYDSVIPSVPFGLTSFMLLLYMLVILPQLKILSKQGFVPICSAFALSFTLLQLLSWLAISAINYRFVDYIPIILQTIMTILIYPIFHIIFTPLYRKIYSKSKLVRRG